MRPRSAHFVISAARPDEFPAPDLPEVAFAGRSNVGKSSLLNALAGQDGLARTSRTPGRTRLINWFRIEAPRPLAFVDLPGYGYAQVDQGTRESWRPLIESYLTDRKTLRAVVLLVDIRRGAEDDELDFVPWLEMHEVTVIPVVTKADKLGKAQRAPAAMAVRKALGLARTPLLFSAHDGTGVDELWKAILRATGAA